MARVFTAKAAKDYPQHGIKKGDTYYYWTPGFRGRKQMSKTPPKASQLTTSKMSAAYAASEALTEAIESAECVDDLVSALDEAIDAIREVAEEYQDSFDGLPENFQQSSNAQDMEQKASELNDWADNLDNDKSEIEGLEASEYADMNINIEDLDEDLIEECDQPCDDCEGSGKIGEETVECIECGGTGKEGEQECKVCAGTGCTEPEREDCPTCDGTGQVQMKSRKDVSDFDDLTDEEKSTMLDAAREIAQQNADCPL